MRQSQDSARSRFDHHSQFYQKLNPVISFTGPTKDSLIGESATFSGVDYNGVVFDVTATAQTGTSASSNTVTEITTVTDNAMAVYIYGIKDNLTSTITNFEEKDDTGTAAGSDAQACFATKSMPTAGGVGSSTLTYTASGINFVVYKFALRPLVSISVSPAASSYILSSTNPTTIQGLISFAPQSISYNLGTTAPSIIGQGILFEAFTELGGAMALASFALLFDDNGNELATTGGYVQGTGITITDPDTIGENLWTATISPIDLISATVKAISIYDSNIIKICSWTFDPPIEIDKTEYTFNWPETGITFPSPQWINTTAANTKLNTTDPTVIYGSISKTPTASTFEFNTSDPFIPTLATISIIDGSNLSDASYILVLDDEENEISTTGTYTQGTGVLVSNSSFVNNRLYADNFSIDLVAERTVLYLDLYDSSDNKLVRWTTGDAITGPELELNFSWPTGGIYYLDNVVDVFPAEVTVDLSSTDPTLVFGSTVASPTLSSFNTLTTDPYVILTQSGSLFITPGVSIFNPDTTDPTVIYGSISFSPVLSECDIKTIIPTLFYSDTTASPTALECDFGTTNPEIIIRNLGESGSKLSLSIEVEI